MFDSKYSKVLTVILIIVIIAIVALLGFLAFDYYQNYIITKETSEFVEAFEGDKISTEGNTTNNENIIGSDDPFNQIESSNTSATGGSSSDKPTFKGFTVVGTMKIPAINLEYPIFEKATKQAIENSIAVLYPTPQNIKINEAGNTVIIGHNYRNGLFFSNNKKLNIGDKIYITDNSGRRLEYTIYNKFETEDPNDASFYQRDTNGKPEVTLSTCTDDSSQRLIIFAKAE